MTKADRETMKPAILLVNPPIYDFAAYDFWLRPYGLLSAAGRIRTRARFEFFDYMDRDSDFTAGLKHCKSDKYGRGHFYSEKIPHPEPLKTIPRYFRRFGQPENIFRQFLRSRDNFDFALIQTSMTYWYPGVAEVISDIRRFSPKTKIILGGPYATLCTEHAKNLSPAPDMVLKGTDLTPLWKFLSLEPDPTQPALWQVYDRPSTGVLKISDGCPFRCTYCSVPVVYGRFRPRNIERALRELQLLIELGAKNIAFYDDALLYRAEDVLMPFLHEVIRLKINVNFHSPNALNARFITREIAEVMIEAGFKTFYLGFESVSADWQKNTGSKVFSNELCNAVQTLTEAGADPSEITAYQILGHPQSNLQQLEESMYFVNSLGIKGMLADFSPIPTTPDGQACGKWVDLNEPLLHNKTAFPTITLGFDKVNQFKDMQRKLNRSLKQ